jgi:hypothetical protein
MNIPNNLKELHFATRTSWNAIHAARGKKAIKAATALHFEITANYRKELFALTGNDHAMYNHVMDQLLGLDNN